MEAFSKLRSEDLIGRSSELERLVAMLDAIETRGEALRLRGEAGIGKSVLLAAVERKARDRGFRVLRTAGVEVESRLPLAGLHRLLRPVMADVEELSELHRSALRAVFGIGGEPVGDPLLVAVATMALLVVAAGHSPVLVIADDLHWLDPSSRDVIAFLARHVAEHRLIVLAAIRDAYEELGDLGIPELLLTGLSDSDAETLLARHAGELEPGLRTRLLSAAAGNPLALVELPAATTIGPAWGSFEATILPVSARLERAFARRVDDVPPRTRSMLLLAAADPDVTLEDILHAGMLLTGHRADDDVVRPAVEAGLVSIEADRLAFRHPLVRSAIYQAASLSERSTAHLALSKVLEPDEDRRTWHLAAATADRDDEVARAVEGSSRRAHARGAILESALLLGRAAELSADLGPRAERLLRAAELAFQAGREDVVQRFVDEAQRSALSRRDQARAELLSEIFYDGVAGDVGRVLSLTATARELGREGEIDLALELLKGASLRCWWAALDLDVRLHVLEVIDELPVAPTDPRRMAIIAIVAPMLRGPEILELLPKALAAVGDDAPAVHLLGIAAHAVGDHDGARAILVPLVDRFRREGRFGLLTQVQSMLQWDMVMLGNWTLAAESATEGDRLARETGQPVWGAGLTCGLCAVAGVRGDEELAEELAAEAESVIIPRRLGDMHCVLLTARGIAALSAGRFDHAYKLLARVFDRDDPAYHWREQLGAVSFLADAAVFCGRGAEATSILEGLDDLLADSTAPALRFAIRYASVVLAPDDAGGHEYAEVLCIAERGRPFDVARLRLMRGIRLTGMGRHAEGHDELERAERLFADAGAPAWSELARNATPA